MHFNPDRIIPPEDELGSLDGSLMLLLRKISVDQTTESAITVFELQQTVAEILDILKKKEKLFRKRKELADMGETTTKIRKMQEISDSLKTKEAKSRAEQGTMEEVSNLVFPLAAV